MCYLFIFIFNCWFLFNYLFDQVMADEPLVNGSLNVHKGVFSSMQEAHCEGEEAFLNGDHTGTRVDCETQKVRIFISFSLFSEDVHVVGVTCSSTSCALIFSSYLYQFLSFC